MVKVQLLFALAGWVQSCTTSIAVALLFETMHTGVLPLC
jgi:hypothetical protein